MLHANSNKSISEGRKQNFYLDTRSERPELELRREVQVSFSTSHASFAFVGGPIALSDRGAREHVLADIIMKLQRFKRKRCANVR